MFDYQFCKEEEIVVFVQLSYKYEKSLKGNRNVDIGLGICMDVNFIIIF